MALIDYPVSVLPLPLVFASPSHSEKERLLRTQMDSGFEVVRKRFTRIPVNFSFELILTQGALSFFQAWFAEEIDFGLNFFNMDMPVGDSLLSSHEVRFLENPKYTLNGKLWKVSAKIEALEINLGINYDSVTLGLIDSLGGPKKATKFEQASIYFDKFDVAVNVTYPDSGFGPGS